LQGGCGGGCSCGGDGGGCRVVVMVLVWSSSWPLPWTPSLPSLFISWPFTTTTTNWNHHNEIKSEHDGGVHCEGHDEVEVKGNEVEDGLNWTNLTKIETYLNKTKTIIIKTVRVMWTVLACTIYGYQFKQRE